MSTYEIHEVEHNGLIIKVRICLHKGVRTPLSYVVYKDGKAINHRLSDKFIKKIDEIIHDYCDNINIDIH